MIILGTGVNYVTQTFTFVKRSVDFGFQSLQDILVAIGLPWQVYMLIIVGFSVVYILVGFVFDSFRGSADSILSDYAAMNRRQAAIQAREESRRNHARYMEIYKERTDMYKERNKRLLEYWNGRHFQKWKEDINK